MKFAKNQSTDRNISAFFQRFFLSLSAAGIFMTSHAQSHPTNPVTVTHKHVNSSRAFENVEITGDIIVVLTNARNSDITMRGNDKDIAVLTAVENENSLQINAERKKTMAKLVVYLPAASMHLLKINGEARVFSSGDIVVDDLQITVNGDSIVKVSYLGKLTVTPADGYEMSEVLATY
jgi:hypothetical protein